MNNILDVNTIQQFYLSAVILLFFIFLKNNEIVLDNIYLLLILLLILIIIISGLLNNNTILSGSDITQYLLLFLTITVSTNIFKNHDLFSSIKFVSIFITHIAFLIAVIGIFQVFNLHPFNLMKLVEPGSTFASRMFSAEYFAIALPFVLFAIISAKGKIRWIIYSELLVVLFYAMLLRSRILYMFLAILFGISIAFIIIKIIFQKRLEYKFLIYFIPIFIIIALGTINYSDMGRGSFENVIHSYTLSSYENSHRLISWETALEIFFDNPIIGTGANSFAGIFPRYNSDFYNDKNIYEAVQINPHNDFLELLAETGILSFFIYSLFIFIIIKRVYSANFSHNNLKEKKYLTSLFLLSILAFLMVSSVGFTKDRISPLILVSIIAAAVSNSCYKLQIKTRLIFLTLPFLVFLYLGIQLRNEYLFIDSMKDKLKGNYRNMILSLDNLVLFPTDKTYTPIDYWKGVGYFSIGNYTLASEKFSSALSISPFNPLIWSNVGVSEYKEGQKNSGINNLKKAITLFPNLVEVRLNLLKIYRLEDNNQEFLLLYEDTLTQFKDSLTHNKLRSLKNYD